MNRPSPELVTSAPLPYMISRPDSAGYDAPTWPLLCFLHGYDEGQPTPIEQGVTRHGPLRPGSSGTATAEFIVVAPQMPVSGDFWHRYAEEVRELVEHVQKKEGADPARTFLTGFSFGGNGVFDLALKQPDLWRALWPVDPTRVPGQEPHQPIWLSSGKISRFSEERFIQRLQLERLRPEQTDQIVPGKRIYLDQSQDHVGTATLAYRDDRIYRWLLAQ